MPINRKIVNKLIIAHWNANGISNKYIELREFLNKYKIDIMLINESKLSNKSKYYGYRGYTSYRKDRDRQGGGLLVLVKNNIPSQEVILNTLKMETLGIKLKK